MADKKLLDEDGVSQFAEETKKYIDKHIDNADIHVTATDKSNWNGKQDALTAEQLAAVNSGINATAKGNYDAHIANADIHVTTVDKANWSGKQDALTSQQIDNINDVVNKANASDLTAHTNNADIHVTATDKSNWNGKQDALTAEQLANIDDVVNKANASDLSAVATSGSYNDLSDKPTIPTVNNATLTIQKNGTTVKTFTANASSNVTANIVVPTKTSELTNDSGFLTTALPIGSYIQFAGSQAPDGFLVCNGGAISRTTYAKLFAVIGTTYGSGDGSTTFNLPNLTDRFLQGSASVGSIKDAGLPNITGGVGFITAPAYSNGQPLFSNSALDWGRYGPGAPGTLMSDPVSICYDLKIDASISNSIYGNSATVQPPALTCLICIKY